jgi:hypothetical protein
VAVDEGAQWEDVPRTAQGPGAMTAAAVRRCKIRKRAGLGVLRVEVALGPFADQCVEDKFLAEWDTENRAALERAAKRVLAIYSLGANALPNPRD